jgi:antitoxin ParD1/3/4
MGVNVHLTPALERFARECVADGRYNNVSEVVRDALRRLQDAEERKRAFVRSLDAAIEESERDGYATLEEVVADMDAIIAAAKQ